MADLSNRFRDGCFIFLVSACLIVPVILWASGWTPPGNVEEKRTKKDWHFVVAGGPRNWSTRFEAYFNDNFGFRDTLVSAWNQLDYSLLRSNAKVIVGKENWLFLERGLNANMPPILDDLCGRLPFSDTHLTHWSSQLTGNAQRLSENDQQYVLMIVPNKHTLYRRYLPTHLQCPESTTRLQQLRTQLTTRSEFAWLDLHPALIKASRTAPRVYHRTDTHWNRVGVYLAYDLLLERLNAIRKARDPKITSVLKTGRIVDVTTGSTGGDLTLMLGVGDPVSEVMEGFKIRRSMAKLRRDPLPGYSEDPWRQPVAFTNPSRADLPRILVFHDSFIGTRVQLLLAETFSHATFVWNSGPDIPFDVVEKVKPDIVIHEMVERSLLQPLTGIE